MPNEIERKMTRIKNFMDTITGQGKYVILIERDKQTNASFFIGNLTMKEFKAIVLKYREVSSKGKKK